MARTYFSAALDHTADQVWAVVRRFDRYEWTGIKAGGCIEGGFADNEAGATRYLQLGAKRVYERLISHTDVGRSYVYESCEPAFGPMRHYRATISVYPIVEIGKAFVERWADFAGVAREEGQPIDEDLDLGFAKSLISLRSFMAARNAERVLSASVEDRRLARDAHTARRVILRLVQ